jgi:hypothetical protein
MKLATPIVAVLIGLALTSTGIAQYYVSPGGSNGNTGLSTEQAWQTIAYAEENAPNGSTVYCMDGSFGAVTINRAGQSSRASWDDAITFTPYDDDEPVMTQLTISGNYDRYLIFDGIGRLTLRTLDAQALIVRLNNIADVNRVYPVVKGQRR